MKKVLSPPQVRLIAPARDVIVNKREVWVQFEIDSAIPLKKVHVVCQGQPAPLPVNLARVQRKKSGEYHLAAGLDVKLPFGLNFLHVEAFSASGLGRSPGVVAAYTAPLVEVVLDRLVVRGGRDGQAVTPRGRWQGMIEFPEIAQATVRLEGRLRWSDEQAAQEQADLPVRAFVNGFQQVPGKLDPSGTNKRERPFKVDLLLNRERGNHIHLLVSKQAQPIEIVVDCRQPIKEQRLHLLILNPAASDRKAVQAEVLQAIESPPDERPRRAPGFVRVEEPQVIVEWRAIAFEFLETALDRIEHAIQNSARTERNEVVLIYFQGGEAVTKEGNFFLRQRSGKQGEEVRLKCDRLVERLATIPGAHLLLLDVERLRRGRGGAKAGRIPAGMGQDQDLEELLPPRNAVPHRHDAALLDREGVLAEGGPVDLGAAQGNPRGGPPGRGGGADEKPDSQGHVFDRGQPPRTRNG